MNIYSVMAFPCVYVVAVGSTSGLAFRGTVYWLLFLYSVFQDPNAFITVFVHPVCIFVGVCLFSLVHRFVQFLNVRIPREYLLNR